LDENEIHPCVCKNVHYKPINGIDALKWWEDLWSWVNQCFPQLKFSSGTTCGFGDIALALQ